MMAVESPPVNADTILANLDRTAGECWLWQRSIRPDGYGQVRWNGRPQLVHRVVYELLVGPIPDDRPQLDHLCRVRHCARPEHLEPVTNRENGLRGFGASGLNAAKDTCAPHGHSLEDAYISAGARRCRPCHVAAQRRYREERRAHG